MKNKFFMKLISCICVFVMAFMLSVSCVYAGSGDGKAKTDANGIVDIPISNKGVKNSGIEGATNTVLGFVQFIGYAIAIGMLIYVGIKYVMASADEKASLKNAMIRYVIGAVLIAGATSIASWIFGLGTNLK